MKKACVLFLTLWLTASCAQSNLSPMQLSKKIFSVDSFPDLNKHITGEYNGHPNGHDDIKPSIKTSFELLSQNTHTAVIAVRLSDSTGVEMDTYLHFKKDTVWKAAAFRALAMTGMIQAEYSHLKALTPLQIDSIINATPKMAKYNKLFASKNEYLYLLNNAQLILSNDKQLTAYFVKNRARFDSLKTALLANGIMRPNTTVQTLKNGKLLHEKIKGLFLHHVHADDGTYLNFTIGGMLDNTIGYLYVPNVANVPEMSPDNFIMIKNIAPHWYLYKTT